MLREEIGQIYDIKRSTHKSQAFWIDLDALELQDSSIDIGEPPQVLYILSRVTKEVLEGSSDSSREYSVILAREGRIFMLETATSNPGSIKNGLYSPTSPR